MKKLLPAIVVIAISIAVNAQNATPKWTGGVQARKVFIENKGQFDEWNKLAGSPVLYTNDDFAAMLLFTKAGLTYRLEKKTQKEVAERENEKVKSYAEKEAEEHRLKIQTDVVQMKWLNSNPNVQVIAEESESFYYNYATVSRVPVFRKLVYKELYPNIDVEYIFHPQYGIEYSFILHPGADVSQIQMKYSDVSGVYVTEHGDINLPTAFGPIIDHAPVSYYSSATKNTIASRFAVSGKTVSFKLDGYDNSKDAVIDPWTVTPAMPNANTVFYIKSDEQGNAYLFGGDNPIRLQKYDAAGTLQWTYNTPWNSGSVWFGAMVTDHGGNCYITDGTGATCRKIDSTGAFVWSNSSTQPPADATEYWALALNCDQTQVFVAGSRHVPFSFSFNATVFKINMTNGSVASYKNVAHKAFTGSPSGISEVRSMCSSPNGNYYYLTLDSVGGVDDNLNIQMGQGTGYNFPYYMLYSSPSGSGQGQNNICADGQFIYTTDGGTLHKRDINSGSVLGTVAIPGGAANNNSGIAVDSCGNIYVGAQTKVHKFDASLTLVTSGTTPEPVYDVSIGKNGDVLACGHGFAVSLALNACPQIKPICVTTLTANANGTDASCNQCNGTATANPITGTPPYSYLWSTTETTQSINGLCAGPYTVTITDNNSNSVTALVTIAQTGGTGTVSLTTGTTTICAGDSSQFCAPAGYTSYQWNNGATTQCITVKNAGNYYCTVTQSGGCTGESNHVALNVHPQPPVSISVNGDTLTAYNSNSYQWYMNGSPISGATGPVWIANQAGSYQVAVTDINGCVAFSNPVVISGIENISGLNGIRVYPNPLTSGPWMLEVLPEMVGSTMELVDVEGRLVYKTTIKSPKSQIEANVAKGVYLMKVNTPAGQVSIKLTHL